VNSIITEPQKEFEPKIAHIFETKLSDFAVMGSNVKIRESVRQWRHNNHRFAVEDHLVFS